MHDPGPAFRALHQPGNPFILANAWDKGSAKLLAYLGAQALGTTSNGHAFTLGLPDMGHVTRDQSLAHAQDIVSATPLPVSGDFENGYGDDPDIVAQTIRLACEAGLAGCSIEDTSFPTTTPYEFDVAVERIKAAVSAARALPRDFVLVARADGIMNGHYDFDEALRRLQAFDALGADCLYAPIPKEFQDIKRFTSSLKAPFNALAAGPYIAYSKAQFAAAGVARISLGSALSRYVFTSILEGARPILEDGDFSELGKGLSGGAFNDMLKDDSLS
jgi:2-methylisocitrate lyase-like PEP mutase family enzyme